MNFLTVNALKVAPIKIAEARCKRPVGAARSPHSSYYCFGFAGVALAGTAGFAATLGAAPATADAGGAGGAIKAVFTDAGTLSEFASNTLTSQLSLIHI